MNETELPRVETLVETLEFSIELTRKEIVRVREQLATLREHLALLERLQNQALHNGGMIGPSRFVPSRNDPET